MSVILIKKLIKKRYDFVTKSIHSWLSVWQFCFLLGLLLGLILLEINLSLFLFGFFILIIPKQINKSLFLTCFIFGILISQIQINQIKHELNKFSTNKSEIISGRIVTKPVEREFYSFADISIDNSKLMFRAEFPKYSDINYLDRIKFKANLKEPTDLIGDFEYRKFLQTKMIFLVATEIEIIEKYSDSIFLSGISTINSIIEENINRHVNEPSASLINGVVLGNKASIPKEIAEDIKNSGVSHLIVVSGLHFSLVLGLVLNLTGILNRRFLLIVAMILGFSYLLLTGITNISTQRAFFSILIVLFLQLFGRKNFNFLTIPIVVIILVFDNPYIFKNISFLLSFGAVLSLTLFLKNLKPNSLLNNILLLCITTIKINILILPIIFLTFQEISMLAIISNVILTPFIPLFITLSILLIFTLFLNITVLVEFIGYILDLLANIFLKITETIASFEFSTTNDIATVLIYYIFCILILLGIDYLNFQKSIFFKSNPENRFTFNFLRNFKFNLNLKLGINTLYFVRKFCKKFKFALVISLTLILPFLVFLLDKNNFYNRNKSEITFLDIGQGDSILITNYNGQIGIIDSGKSNNLIFELSKQIPSYFRKIGFVLATHPDSDHIEGFISLVKRYKIEKFFINKYPKDSSIYRKLIQLLDENKIQTINLTDKDDFSFGEFIIDVIWPPSNKEIFSKDFNNHSISTILTAGNIELFTFGDLDREHELMSLENYNNKIGETFKILKVSHHGSKSSTSIEFLDRIMPDLAIISVGYNNRYGHPHNEVLDLLNQKNIPVLRTDINSTITIPTTGFETKL